MNISACSTTPTRADFSTKCARQRTPAIRWWTVASSWSSRSRACVSSAASQGRATRAARPFQPARSLFSNNYGRCPELALRLRASRGLAAAVFLAGLRLRRLAGALAAVHQAGGLLAPAARRRDRVRLHYIFVDVIAARDEENEHDPGTEGAETVLSLLRGNNYGRCPELDFERALHARTRADLAAPALEVRHAGDELGEGALGAPVAGVERQVGDGHLVAGVVLALGEEAVLDLEVALEALLEHLARGDVRLLRAHARVDRAEARRDVGRGAHVGLEHGGALRRILRDEFPGLLGAIHHDGARLRQRDLAAARCLVVDDDGDLSHRVQRQVLLRPVLALREVDGLPVVLEAALFHRAARAL